MKQKSKHEHKLQDYVKVTKGFFEGREGVLVNIDYDGASFKIQIDDPNLVHSEEEFFVYADEIELVAREVILDDDGDDTEIICELP